MSESGKRKPCDFWDDVSPAVKEIVLRKALRSAFNLRADRDWDGPPTDGRDHLSGTLEVQRRLAEREAQRRRKLIKEA
jgi:hypothetical protein